MTITLTREEAQQVLDAFAWELGGEPLGTEINKAVETLRTKLTQPEREWQGLTDEEIMSLLPGAVRLPPGWSETVRAIEAKLKEKNS
jgi:hypothetical protein